MTQQSDTVSEPETAPAKDKATVVDAEAHAAASTSQTKPKKKPKWNDEANHGRYGFDDYPGLETAVLSHPVLHPGDACPHCQEANQTAKSISMTQVH